MRLTIPTRRPVGPLIRPVSELWFPFAVLGFVAVSFAFRLAHCRTLQYDEAEQLLLAQTLAPGYNAQPPLYTWLVWAAMQVFGATAGVVVGVRAAVLVGVYVAIFACGRAVLPDPGRAGVAAFAVLLLPAFCWEFVMDKTHTPLACGFAAAALAALVRGVRRGGVGPAVALGLAVGLGALSKSTFAVFAAALVAAAVTVPAYRRWLLSRYGLIAAGVAAVVAAPYTGWVVANWGFLRGQLAGRMVDTEVAVTPGRFMMFVWLVFAVVQAGGAMAVGLAVAFPRAFRRGPAGSDEERLLGRFLAAAAGLLAAAVVGGGMSIIRGHWLVPVLMVVPLWAFCRAGRGDGVAAGWDRLRVIVGLVVVGTSVAHLSILLLPDAPLGRVLRARDRLYTDFAGRVGDLPAAPRTIVTDSVRDAGNLKLAVPAADVVLLDLPAGSRPAIRGPVLIVWDATKQDDPAGETVRALEAAGLSLPPGAAVCYVGGQRTPAAPHHRRLGFVWCGPVTP